MYSTLVCHFGTPFSGNNGNNVGYVFELVLCNGTGHLHAGKNDNVHADKNMGATYNRVPYDDYILASNVHLGSIKAVEAETQPKTQLKEKRKEDDFSE